MEPHYPHYPSYRPGMETMQALGTSTTLKLLEFPNSPYPENKVCGGSNDQISSKQSPYSHYYFSFCPHPQHYGTLMLQVDLGGMRNCGGHAGKQLKYAVCAIFRYRRCGADDAVPKKCHRRFGTRRVGSRSVGNRRIGTDGLMVHRYIKICGSLLPLSVALCPLSPAPSLSVVLNLVLV